MTLDWKDVIFNLIGGLGIFLFGMKTMSSGMQQLAGNRIKKFFDMLTNNRLMGVGVGLVVTAIIQSSSATTVMLVGFINAGLMDLQQAVGIIMGANIGTTITSWIIAIKITKFALPVLGVGSIMAMFSKNRKVNNWGYIFLGFGMLFFGLKLMETAFHPLRESQEFITFFAQFGADSTLQIIKSAFAGMLLTCIIQSSSATIGITIALANQGLLTYPAAAALVLGENIGTTITMNLAAIGANVAARRAGRVHMLFNTFGTVVMIAIFPWFVKFVDYIVPGGMDAVGADGTKIYIAAHIAAGHSLFNITNTLLFFFLTGFLVKIAIWMVPDEGDKPDKQLEYIDYSFISTPSIALGQAKKEIIKMSQMDSNMLDWSRTLLLEQPIDEKLKERLFKYEIITDTLQTEISKFCATLLQKKPGPEDAESARRYLRISDEYESIGDMCEQLAKYAIRREEQNLDFSDEALEGLEEAYRSLQEYFQLCTLCFIDEKNRTFHEADAKNNSLQKMIKKLRRGHLERLNNRECDVMTGLLLSDILATFQSIRGHAHNIVETVAGLK